MPRPSKSEARQQRQASRRKPDKNQALADNLILKYESSSRPTGTRVEVVPITSGQKRYDAAFKSSDIIFGVGPAGTGKTWFAVQRAVQALLSGQADKIFVTRPAVEVERSMGFLPGELEEKYAPYLRPLEEAFIEALGKGRYEYMVKAKMIEAVPLAFMRGSTLKNGWVLADEMQNATDTEFKMFLTRIGEGAKFIINGDPRQVDRSIRSGLENAIRKIGALGEISVVRFGRDEVVRSGLAQKIVECFEDDDAEPNDEGLRRLLEK